MLVLLLGNPLCYGFTTSTLKHTGLGIGKVGFASFCMYGVMSTLLREKIYTEWDQNGNAREVTRNFLLTAVTESYNSFKSRKLRDFLCESYTDPLMDWALHDSITSLVSIGCLTYGAYKSTSSAGTSFKEAWNSLKKTTGQVNSESSKKTLSTHKSTDTFETKVAPTSENKEAGFSVVPLQRNDEEPGSQREIVDLI